MTSDRVLYTLFLLSGAASLTYQVIWLRWLGLIFGSTTASVSIVLSSFMLGLAAGSWLAGRSLGRARNPLAIYGWLELGIGVFALGFPIVTVASDGLFMWLVAADSPQAWSLVVRAGLAFSVLVIPTTLMGATLPLMTEYVRREAVEGRGWRVGLLYGFNTLGAALGTIAASFICIELFGVRSTGLLAAALNLGVGCWALRLSSGPRSAAPAAPVTTPGETPFESKLAIAVLAASGASALASEVLWTRTLESLIGNSTYAFALMLVVYLIGIALGSALVSLWVKRIPHLALWLIATQAATACWIVVAIGLFYALAAAMQEYAHSIQPVGFLLATYLKSSAILFPLALLSGAAFPIATRMLDPHANDAGGALVARAYSWNTLGAVLGAAFAGFVLAPKLDFIQSIYALVALYGGTALCASAALLLARSPIRTTALAVSITLAVGVTTLGLVRSADSGRFVRGIQQSHPDAEVLYHEPGFQAVTTVVQSRAGRSLLENGRGMTTQVTATKMMAHLPMLVHPDPEDTLVICFGMGTSYRSAITHDGRVTTVELVDEVFDAFDHFFDDADAVRAYPNGRMITNDGRNFLKLTRDRYDVITIDPPPPIDGAGINHLYSYDFLELARARLKPGGIMAHWIPAPHARAGVDDWDTFAMLLRTFARVFPHQVVIPSYPWVGLHVLGSIQPITTSRKQLEERLARRPAVARDIDEWGGLPEGYFDQRVVPEGKALQGDLLVTDNWPRLEFNLLRSWRAKSRKSVPYVWW